tara:strand:+ start:1432 stop:2859 length:1428 start_codon:yes stop_codon:yes gene_type:complete
MKTQLTLLAAAVVLAGCGGGGSDDSAPTYTLSGTVNAHAANGDEKVCIDLNQDFICDANEPSTKAAGGKFSFTSASKAILDAPIVVELDTGVTTLSAYSNGNGASILVAPGQRKASGNNVNAISTLVAGQVASGDTVQSAVRKVSVQLGKLGLPNDDILNNGDASEYQTLEQNVLTLTSAIDSGERNAQLFALASKLNDYRSFVLDAAPSDEDTTNLITKLESVVAQKGFNDTGITQFFADGAVTEEAPADYPGQDASFGHDAKDGGFKFVKLDNNRQELAADAQQWSCVQDQRTGLIWETKLNDESSPRHVDRLFAYQESGVIDPYYEDIDVLGCRDSDNICTTEEYVNYLNTEAVCGLTNWRLPTSHEVYNLIDFGETQTDESNNVYGFTKQFFPLQSIASYYETGVIWTKFASFSEYSDQAWANGHFFNAIETRGASRGSISPQEIYTSESPADSGDSYQFAIRLVADVEAK